jgi:dihydroorotate dehydrogenase electron transfer subunit
MKGLLRCLCNDTWCSVQCDSIIWKDLGRNTLSFVQAMMCLYSDVTLSLDKAQIVLTILVKAVATLLEPLSWTGESCYHVPVRTFKGRIAELRLTPSGEVAAWIACPSGGVPVVGQCLLACALEDEDQQLPVALFPGEAAPAGFLAVPPLPSGWDPGTSLALRGPLGKGFRLPTGIRRLALAALGETAARLLPLATLALGFEAEVALYTDLSLPALPASIEFHPAGALPECLDWTELLAIDIPLQGLPGLRVCLGLGPQGRLPCAAQVLVRTDMPCGGLAECGACAVSARRGWCLVCRDGPVFDLQELDW